MIRMRMPPPHNCHVSNAYFQGETPIPHHRQRTMFEDAWVLIPLAAILIGGFMEYVKFKARQDKLGDSTKETEIRLTKLNERLEEQNRALVRRIQNLEAIVTSQTWDDIHGLPGRSGADHRSGSAAEPQVSVQPALDEALDADYDSQSDERRAEELARRLRDH